MFACRKRLGIHYILRLPGLAGDRVLGQDTEVSGLHVQNRRQFVDRRRASGSLDASEGRRTASPRRSRRPPLVPVGHTECGEGDEHPSEQRCGDTTDVQCRRCDTVPVQRTDDEPPAEPWIDSAESTAWNHRGQEATAQHGDQQAASQCGPRVGSAIISIQCGQRRGHLTQRIVQ